MHRDRLEEAARCLVDARRQQRTLEALPKASRPDDETEAYRLQDRLHDILEQEGFGSRIGRKIGCTTDVMQRYLGIDSPCAGGLFDSMVETSPARFAHGRFRRPGVECEIAVRLGADLPPRDGGHDRESVAASVESCMAAIEIVDDRYVDFRSLDTPTLIADDFFNAGAVLGPEVSDWRALDLASLEGRMVIDGEIVGHGVGAAILGHPFEALAWLARAENARGRMLRAGEIVLLGSLVQTNWVDADARIQVTVDGLGEASVHFT